MRRNTLVMLAVVVLFGVASSATAQDCRPVFARVGVATYLDGPCYYNGEEYVFCVDTPLKGMLRGTWHFLSKPAWNIFELEVPDGTLGIPGWDLWVGWSLSVIETHQGDIIMQENEILNLDAYFNYGAISGMANIIGGTGRYEGATGWIGVVFTESQGGVLRGMVCSP